MSNLVDELEFLKASKEDLRLVINSIGGSLIETDPLANYTATVTGIMNTLSSEVASLEAQKLQLEQDIAALQ